MNWFKKILKIIFVVSLIVFACAYFQKDKLPEKEQILSELYQAPIQSKTFEEPFTIEKNGIVYEITPLFEYELYGLVVTEHSSGSWLDYYREKWKDFINLKDLCVVWGENIESRVYQELTFKSGSYTCYIDFKSGVDRKGAYEKFKNEALSNNHLLSENDELNQRILKAQRGDQVYLKGYLAKYSHDDFSRGSSTTRSDSGNGACETIYLTDFEIIKEANVFWRLAYSVSGYLIITSAIFLVIMFLWRSEEVYE